LPAILDHCQRTSRWSGQRLRLTTSWRLQFRFTCDAQGASPPAARADFNEARGLVHDLIGGPMPIRQRADGRAIL